ncbi:hypothetical protein HYC85_027382 [Camellia sinensis]|uniref:D-isomer specific 2-hydroxyacid dehydrogenase NAD-binding domain-containing protein n=1 Tax=Camellia sinensis TaxID=4442 RepID=A0A7J7G695_CAMSI|nr:hypothetical protein HYC85_027382 [Camellia sinensis]
MGVDDVPFDDVPNVIGNYDICIVKSMWLDANVISHATRMKLIMQYGVGLEGVDINTATKHGIKVARIPSGASGNAASCAEMVIYLMLGVLPSLTQNGMNDDLVDDKGFHEDIHTFASNADVVICCLLMNSETLGLCSSACPTGNRLSHTLPGVLCGVRWVMREYYRGGALLVNIARGGLLDCEAILYHLKSGHLGGLGMDVAWTEPFDPEDPILKFPNVLITPHVAAVTGHAVRSTAKVVGNVALQLHAGSPLTGIEFVN